MQLRVPLILLVKCALIKMLRDFLEGEVGAC
jgi:hypothetical protein